MNKDQFLELQSTSPANRRAFFSYNFLDWWIYYFLDDFKYPLAPFHMDWIETLSTTDLNILIKGFRGSIKTSIVVAYLTWCICYSKHKFIVWQSFGSDSSERMTKQIALNLMRSNIEQDYGVLFKTSGSREDMTKKSIGDFDTTNGVKVLATSLGEKLRGAISRNSRPDLLVLDDIDVSDSVRNVEIIDKNYQKITGETIGAMSKEKSRIIFLGNVINQDGVVPRFENEKANDKNWKAFVQPLYNDDDSIAWDFFTPERIEKIRSNEGDISFNQNYLLIPYSEGSTIIKRTDIRYANEYPQGSVIFFGIDPAFSEKTNSDSMALTITAHYKNDKYVVASYEAKGKEKDEERFVGFVESLYRKYACCNITVEANNGGEIIGRMLSKRNMAVTIEKAVKDKITRLREYEGCFSRGEVYFLPGTEPLVTQLLGFPNLSHDDMVDSMVYSFRKKNLLISY